MPETTEANLPRQRPLRIGTRASALARWQADWVAAQLRRLEQQVEIVHVTTKGDVSSQPLGVIGGRGVFTKEIQRALLDDEIDIAVHSLKDLPTEPVDGLTLAAVPERESEGDVLVTAAADSLQTLPAGARIGTGSTRRKAQLLYARRDLQVLDIRGNVGTRLRKLDDGLYDAIVLAEAGLRRLGSQDRICQVIPKDVMLPAVGQGALGLETRAGDRRAIDVAAELNDAAARAAVAAERSMLAALQAGCLAPVGAWARIDGGHLVLDAVVLASDGSQRLAATASGSPDDAGTVGQRAAEQLLQQGARELISASRGQ